MGTVADRHRLRLCCQPRFALRATTLTIPEFATLASGQSSLPPWTSFGEFRSSCDIFANFFHELQTSIKSALDAAVARRSYPYICELVKLTRSLPNHTPPTDDPPYGDVVKETISLVLQFYLAFVLRDSFQPTVTDFSLLKSLEHGLLREAEHWRRGFDMLICCMLKIEVMHLGHTGRFHEVVVLMDVARFLPWKYWSRARHILQVSLSCDAATRPYEMVFSPGSIMQAILSPSTIGHEV